MTSDIGQAFEHPEHRAAATADEPMLDRISLVDHIVEVEIGAFQVERDQVQRVSFNLVVELTPLLDDAADDVDRILSYDRLSEAVATELAAERLNLLETLAQRIADRILNEPRAHRVFVRIEKLDRGPGKLGVEIVRDVSQITTAPPEKPAMKPLIIHLSQQMQHHPNLPKWIDAMDRNIQSVIVTLEAEKQPLTSVQSSAIQRRIDLLEIEQNAWKLSLQDPRLLVHGTRTELDWAMKQGRISVWAPSKMVLDAVDGPAGVEGEMVLWLAKELGAAQVIALGESALAAFPDPENIRVIALDAACNLD